MQTDLSKFKEQISLLMDYIKEISGGDSLLEKITIKIKLGLSANPREVIEVFTSEITDYADEILSDNDAFFLEASNFSKDIKSNANVFEDIFNRLKEVWITATPAQKDKIIRYFKLLVILGCIITKNEKLRLVINNYRDPDNGITFD
jgi:hypothetical protein